MNNLFGINNDVLDYLVGRGSNPKEPRKVYVAVGLPSEDSSKLRTAFEYAAEHNCLTVTRLKDEPTTYRSSYTRIAWVVLLRTLRKLVEDAAQLAQDKNTEEEAEPTAGKYLHLKSSRTYRIICEAVSSDDGSLSVVYESLNDEDFGKKYVRKSSEFFDGRFVKKEDEC